MMVKAGCSLLPFYLSHHGGSPFKLISILLTFNIPDVGLIIAFGNFRMDSDLLVSPSMVQRQTLVQQDN